jgi:carboxymethylenebutenolidase
VGTQVTIRSDDDFELSAYRADPDGPPRGAVVVVQEVFGVNSHIRAVADRYADHGYLAIAPALFDRAERGVELGYDTEGLTAGVDLARKRTDANRAVADLEAAGRSAAGVGGGVGIVGYCWGGYLTALCAIGSGDTFSAASSYYGGGVGSLAEQTPVVPLILHFGEEDHAIPLDDVHRLAAAWPHATVHVYDGAQHGFNCDQRDSYQPSAAALAEQRTLDHFATHLGRGR